MKLVLVRCICLAVIVTSSYGDCGYFTYTVNNGIVKPNFNEKIRLNITTGTNLYTYMEEACRQEPGRFTKFTATFFPRLNGYFIDAINGVASNYAVDKSYWEISNADGPLSVGASLYIPKPRDEVLFNLTIFG